MSLIDAGARYSEVTRKGRQIPAGSEPQVTVLGKRKRMSRFNRKYRRKWEETSVRETVWCTGMGREGGLGEHNLAVELLNWVCGAEVDGAG